MGLGEDDRFFDWDAEQMAQIAQGKINDALAQVQDSHEQLAVKLTALAEKVDNCETHALARAKTQLDQLEHKLQLLLTQLENKFDADATTKN